MYEWEKFRTGLWTGWVEAEPSWDMNLTARGKTTSTLVTRSEGPEDVLGPQQAQASAGTHQKDAQTDTERLSCVV